VLVVLLGVVSVASLLFAWRADQRGASLEQELVRRQQDGATRIAEAGLLARQAQEGTSEVTAKLALLEARVAEVAVQRTQLEELIQSLSRSRDENVLTDIEAAIRVALQQSAITGSAEPLVATLKQGDERLARYKQPRLEGVRRAIARDLDRVRSVSVADISTLGIKLDEAIRMIDDLPLVSVAEASKDAATRDARVSPTAAAASKPAKPASSASAAASTAAAWSGKVGDAWGAVTDRLWSEAKSLVRVTRIDHPEAMLLAPEQTFFVRENLKLRLLNARLALLSRQFEIAQSDLQVAQTTLDRYFDRTSKRTLLASDLIRQVTGQARQVVVPRPDDTLAALTAAGPGR
jgi:uroporphyrin-3 C-methyltransferase